MIELTPEKITIVKAKDRQDIIDYNEANNQVYWFDKTFINKEYGYLEGDTEFTDVADEDIVDYIKSIHDDECVLILQNPENTKRMFEALYPSNNSK